MSGTIWQVIIFSAIFIFLVLSVYRVIAILRLPVHLRWELAPIPHEKGKNRYGGSYLEEYEWWRKPRQRSRFAPIAYMLREIFLMRGVWKNRRSFWPFSYSLHAGIYLVIIALFFHLLNALLSIAGITSSALEVLQRIASITAIAGYITGTTGSLGLILKRRLDGNYRPFTTPLMYFKLMFLAAIFISGTWAWSAGSSYGREASEFLKGLVTLQGSIPVAPPLAAHIIIILLFIVYLPFTDMLHFITKYFTYHAVRWNDEPINSRMNARLKELITRPVDWAAPHAGPGKSWAETAAGKKDDAEKT